MASNKGNETFTSHATNVGTGGDAYAHLCDMNQLAKRNNQKVKVVNHRKVDSVPYFLN